MLGMDRIKIKKHSRNLKISGFSIILGESNDGRVKKTPSNFELFSQWHNFWPNIPRGVVGSRFAISLSYNLQRKI